ncbi:hypothetical protein ACFRAO_34260 [Streptomyces sp. NPDC056656]
MIPDHQGGELDFLQETLGELGYHVTSFSEALADIRQESRDAR